MIETVKDLPTPYVPLAGETENEATPSASTLAGVRKRRNARKTAVDEYALRNVCCVRKKKERIDAEVENIDMDNIEQRDSLPLTNGYPAESTFSTCMRILFEA